jgi:hypothetical protein
MRPLDQQSISILMFACLSSIILSFATSGSEKIELCKKEGKK